MEKKIHCQPGSLTHKFFVRQCKSPFIIDYYGAYFVENRIKICTELMDGLFCCLFCLSLRTYQVLFLTITHRGVAGTLRRFARDCAGACCRCRAVGAELSVLAENHASRHQAVKYFDQFSWTDQALRFRFPFPLSFYFILFYFIFFSLVTFFTIISHPRVSAQGVSTQLQVSVTKTFVGTDAYMAPERILAQPYTAKSEVFHKALL